MPGTSYNDEQDERFGKEADSSPRASREKDRYMDRDIDRDKRRERDRDRDTGRENRSSTRSLNAYRTNKAAEGRRYLKWLAFAKSKVSFGFQHLGPAYVPTMGELARGYAICLDKVSGWSIPPAVLREFGKGDYEITVQLSFSMFHLSSSSFFGSTWMGSPVSLGSGDVDIPQVIDFEYSDIVYLVSRIIDPTCVAILEVVVSKFDLRKKLVAAQFGCGWTMLNLFTKPPPPDIMNGYENGEVTSCSLFLGSPRDLLLNNDLKTLAGRLREIPDCNLFFKLFEHRRLLKAQRLLGENEALGRFDPVPGLIYRSVVPPGATKARELACVGDEELLDGRNGPLSLPAVPHLASPITFKVANCQLFVPSRKNLEIKMMASFAKMLNLKDKSLVRIMSRTLKIGLHNGSTVLGGEWRAYALLEDKEDYDILMTEAEVLSVAGYVPDCLMALVFLIEYELGIPADKNTHFNSQAMVRATVVQNGRMITTFTFGSAVYLPCDEEKLLLRNTDRRPDDEEGVDIELKLLKDDICSILSPKPILLDQVSGEDEDEDEDEELAAASRKHIKGDGPLHKERLTLRGAGGEQLEREELGVPLLGFDLKAFHPRRGELSHLDDVYPLLHEDYTAKAPKEKFEEPPPPSPRSDAEEGKREDFKRAPFKGRSYVESPRVSTVREEILKDMDDIRSIPDSLVTGDSSRSSLRLDALYYSSAGDRQVYVERPDRDWDRFSQASGSSAGRFQVPRDRTSLLAQSLQTKMVAKDKVGANILRSAAELLPRQQPQHFPYPGDEMLQVAPKTSIAINSNASHIRELSRGARSRLNRHGFQGAIIDTPLDAAVGIAGGRSEPGPPYRTAASAAQQQQQRTAHGNNVVVDIELEARDELALHEISIQFAGFRAGARQVNANGSNVDMSFLTAPKTVYFSFQFYSCQPTRTEILRLLPAEPGQLCVLARDEAYARDETPLSLRFIVDCSTSSPNEGTEFAEYLAHCALFVDVWDADSLLQLGTIGIPLRKLMRQGQTTTKVAVECDVINADIVDMAQGGVPTTVVADGGPVSGEVVGTVQVILANYGQRGRGPAPKVLRSRTHLGDSDDENEALDGINWRAFGVQLHPDLRKSKPGRRVTSRPKNSVRAKPLSENAPELSQALTEVRRSADGRGASMRSLSGSRGGGGSVCTLNYDEVAVLFRQFRGPVKGTVQYMGALLALLDMPSLGVALRKLIQSYKRFGDHEGMLKEILRHSNANSELSALDLEDFFRVLFERTGVAVRPEELTLLARKFLSDAAKEFVTAVEVVDFCAEEADRHEWTVVGNRLRLAAQKAALEGEDVEQLLAERDADGSHCINVSRFKDFLRHIAKFGSLSPKDINMCCRHFARRPRSPEQQRDPIALKDVMAFLGIDYVGNLQLRIRRQLEQSEHGAPDVKEMLQILNSSSSGGSTERARGAPLLYSYDELEAAFSMLDLYQEITHEQARAIFRKLDAKGAGKLSAAQVLTYLGIAFHASDLAPPREPEPMASEPEVPKQAVDAESVLRLLLEKVKDSGVAVDEAFRHFDADGNGTISKQEFVKALTKLGIFDHIPNWKKQIPEIIRKFDKDGDGEVQLREFFAYLGIKDYAPNIIQRMTKIFAVATQNKLSIKDIFQHLDKDSSGQLDANEIAQGLKELGTFGEVTREDCESVVNQFDKDGDKEVSIDEFVDYFTARVQQALRERRKSRLDKVSAILRKTFSSALSKGATLRDIFGHLDKDGSGTVETAELAGVIKKLPSFKKMSEQDVTDLMDLLDDDNNGNVSFDEFEAFVHGDGDSTLDDSMSVSMGPSGTSTAGAGGQGTLLNRIRDTFKTAEAKGLSFDKAFGLLDTDDSGELTLDELEAALRRLPNFRQVSRAEVQELFDAVDTDRSGKISNREFEDFVKGGKLVADRRRERAEEKKGGDEDDRPLDRRRQRGRGGDRVLTAEAAKDMFIRHIRRIAQIDGSVSALLAYLDDDEDGLIATSALKTLLRREDVFDTLPEERVAELLQPLQHDASHIKTAALLRFVEGSPHALTAGLGEGKDAEGDLVTMPKDYVFSKDPEVKALEKKVRGFGRLLAKKGVDVESMFRSFDARNTGAVRRTELIEVLSKLGMYILEQGQVLDQALHAEKDVHRLQMHQINKLKGKGGDYIQNAPRMARRLLMSGTTDPEGNFKDHLESMTLVNWYRQSQKQMLLQRVLSHSLAHSIRIYPRFGKTLFFEYPVTNPFAHEERFQIEVSDPELRLVTSFDEWIHLRRTCRPCVGEIAMDPVEADMFDRDAAGNCQVALLPHETLHVPFTFMTLIPHTPDSRLGSGAGSAAGAMRGAANRRDRSSSADAGESKRGARPAEEAKAEEELLNEEPHREVEVKILSGTHGHLVCILKVLVCPRPFVAHRTLRFQAAENSILKRRVQVVGHENMSMYPGEYSASSKFVHCVESCGLAGSTQLPNGDFLSPDRAAEAGGGLGAAAGGAEQSRVVVEWGPSSEHFSGMGSLDLLIRYRCGPFPSTGSFYLLIYNDPYQSQLHEVWQVIVQSRLRLDIHGTVGSAAAADLVVRGDRFARRAHAYAVPSPTDRIAFKPDTVFQLVPGAYNRVALSVNPKTVGYRQIQLNVVDADSRELISGWLMMISATSPAIMRSYDVDVQPDRPLHKKIIFKNPWDVPRRFHLSSSDEALMRPRNPVVEVAAHGSAYLRLWFSAAPSGGRGVSGGGSGAIHEVHLFMNDAAGGQNEECYLFRVRESCD